MTRADEARRRAELAAALQHRDDLQARWAVAAYTASSAERVEDLDVELARVDATIAALEDNIPNTGPANLGSSAVDTPPAEGHFLPPGLTQDRLSGAGTYPRPSDVAPAQPEREPTAEPEYLTTREAAAMLGVSVKHLEALRRRQKGPPFVRIGKAVRYPRSTLAR